MFAKLQKFSKLTFVALFLCSGATADAKAETKQAVHDRIENLLGAADDFDTIFTHLKEVFANKNSDEIAEIADLIQFPLTVNGGDGKEVVNNEEEFISNIDDLVPDNVREVVANQRYQDLMVSSDGVMFGNGELWINAICQDTACENPNWAITAINR